MSNESGEREICDARFRDIGNTGQIYRPTRMQDIFPGENPKSIFTHEAAAPYSRDRYATHVSINSNCLITVHTRPKGNATYQIGLPYITTQNHINNSSLTVNGNGSITPNTNEDDLLCQLQITTDDCDVYCSPRYFSQRFLNERLKTEATLKNDIFILPDYSNISNDIITTADQYAILISKGSKVYVNRGGEIGNIRITIPKGRLVVNCNPDIMIHECWIKEDRQSVLDKNIT